MTVAHYEAPAPDRAPVVHTKQVTDMVAWAAQADAAFRVAERIVKTNFCPAAYRQKPDEATAAMLAGAELGFSPMASLRTFDNIQGVATPKAITQRAVLQSLGHDIWPVEQSATRCVVRGRRAGSSEVVESVWTIERATTAGYVKKNPNYTLMPENMLLARATSDCARMVASDALLGIPYSSEEMQDVEPVRATATREHTPVTAAALTGAPPAAPTPTAEKPAPPAAPTAPATISDAQMKRLQAMFSRAGVKDRDARLRVVNKLAPRPISSSKDLTQDEADAVIREMVARGQDAIVAMAAPPAEQDPADAEDDAVGPVAADQRDAERDEVAQAYAELDAEETAAEGEQGTLDDGAGES